MVGFVKKGRTIGRGLGTRRSSLVSSFRSPSSLAMLWRSPAFNHSFRHKLSAFIFLESCSAQCGPHKTLRHASSDAKRKEPVDTRNLAVVAHIGALFLCSFDHIASEALNSSSLRLWKDYLDRVHSYQVWLPIRSWNS